jgi:hypothetical protein
MSGKSKKIRKNKYQKISQGLALSTHTHQRGWGSLERLFFRVSLFKLFCAFFITIATIVVTLNYLIVMFQKPTNKQLVDITTEFRITFWKSFLNLHPGYFPGWVELTELELILGNKDGAFNSYEKAFNISPNATELRELKKNLKSSE